MHVRKDSSSSATRAPPPPASPHQVAEETEEVWALDVLQHVHHRVDDGPGSSSSSSSSKDGAWCEASTGARLIRIQASCKPVM
jgi:hypothetical protein